MNEGSKSEQPVNVDIAGRLAAIQRQIDLLRAQESVLLDLMAEPPPRPRLHAPRSTVKQTLLDMLMAAPEGINAQGAVRKAAEVGVDLDRGTVSSLLSRFKNEGIVDYDGSTYRLRTPARAEAVASEGGAE
jgi:hypothetical protein